MTIVPYTPQQQIARQIKTKRKILRLNQAAVAKAAGTSQTVIARLESGEGNPTFSLIQRVATALDLEMIIRVKPNRPKGITPDWLT